MLDGVKCKTLPIIHGEKGNVIKLIKKEDPHFLGFGEAYFSTIKKYDIKGWKKHKLMTCNLVVISGTVEFVIHDSRKVSKTYGCYDKFLLSENQFKRLTIPPRLWFGFKGMDEKNIILNISDIGHEKSEVIEHRADNNTYPEFLR